MITTPTGRRSVAATPFHSDHALLIQFECLPAAHCARIASSSVSPMSLRPGGCDPKWKVPKNSGAGDQHGEQA